jgi:hypothetical protein
MDKAGLNDYDEAKKILFLHGSVKKAMDALHQ